MRATKLADRYVLEERIAAGGMGAVYLADDERLRRKVAVKLLQEDLAADPSFVERFRREARAAAALSHPNIANVFDYGQDDGHHYIVMEYVKGHDLARVLREEGALDPQRAVAILGQVSDALAHAHAAGVIHRDVKPANIILAENDRVKVTDFGIARAMGESTLTATGSIMGTAHYISPEHASGAAVEPASDVYSLGVVLYETLTGSVPFTGDSPIVVAMRHVADDLPAPSELKPGIPAELDAVVARATAKSPDDRYADATTMGIELRRSLDPTLPVTSPTDTGERTVWPIPGTRWDPQRIGRWVLLVFGALLLVAVTLLTVRLLGDDRQARTRDRDAGAAPAAQESATSVQEPTPPAVAPLVLMPELFGSNVDDAESVLIGMELDLVVTREEISSEAPFGMVVATEPGAGAELSQGQAITLYVSGGSDPVEEGKDKGDKGHEEDGDDD